VPIIARELDEDCTVNKLGQTSTLPKSTLVVFPAFFLHRDERHWPDPEVFKPEV